MMISHYLFEYQRLVSMRQRGQPGNRARLTLISGSILLASIGAWLGHCSLNDCPMFG